MNHSATSAVAPQPWYRKIALILLLPFVLLTVPLELLIFVFFGLIIFVYGFVGTIRFVARMRRRGRRLSFRQVRKRIDVEGGTLIIKSPALGWNTTYAWWTPDEVLTQSPFRIPTDEEYEQAARTMKCCEWDRWLWREYTSPDTGRAFLLRVWNGKSMESLLKSLFPSLAVVKTWTGAMHFPENVNGVEGDIA
jgi:hypothetical protein